MSTLRNCEEVSLMTELGFMKYLVSNKVLCKRPSQRKANISAETQSNPGVAKGKSANRMSSL